MHQVKYDANEFTRCLSFYRKIALIYLFVLGIILYFCNLNDHIEIIVKISKIKLQFIADKPLIRIYNKGNFSKELFTFMQERDFSSYPRFDAFKNTFQAFRILFCSDIR